MSSTAVRIESAGRMSALVITASISLLFLGVLIAIAGPVLIAAFAIGAVIAIAHRIRM